MCLFIFAGKARSDSEPAASSQKSFIPPSLVNPQRPEEDILFQWRLRRKMEQAREGPWHMQHTRLHGPTVSWQTPALTHPPATGPLFKVRLACVTSTFLFIYSGFTEWLIYSLFGTLSAAPAKYTNGILNTAKPDGLPVRSPCILFPGFRPISSPCFSFVWISCLSASACCRCSLSHAFPLWRVALSHPIVSHRQETNDFTRHLHVSLHTQSPWK